VKSPYTCRVPEAYPVLVAAFGGLEEAHAAIDREPTLLRHWASHMLPVLVLLRRLLGKELAQKVLQKAPYLFLREDVMLRDHPVLRRVQVAFPTLVSIFGEEEALRMIEERPELLTLGFSLRNAMRYAERKLGSKEKVRDNFEGVLRRTGLAEHSRYMKAPRPRQGYWSPARKAQIKRIIAPWTARSNPMGRDAPVVGRWDAHIMDDESQDDEIEAEENRDIEADEDEAQYSANEDAPVDADALQEEEEMDDMSDNTLPFSVPTYK